MRCFALVLLVSGIFLTAAKLPAAEPVPDVNGIKNLINQLGSARWSERVNASAALEKVGEPALPLLRDALKSSDLEIRRRAEELFPRIEVQIDTARALTPLRVRFTCKDATVPEAVAAFAKQTGHPIRLGANAANMAARRITLDTGETTFWDAFNQLCAKAGVHDAETVEQVQPNQDVYATRVVRARAGLRGNAVYYAGQRPTLDQTLVLDEGPAQGGAAVRNGSLRVRALPPKSAVFTDLPDGGRQITLHLEFRTEARMDLTELIGVRIQRATDGAAQKVRSATDYSENGLNGLMDPDVQMLAVAQNIIYDGGAATGSTRQVPVSVTIDGKAVEKLSELTGIVMARIKTAPETLVTISDLSKAVGNAQTATDGSEVKVTECKCEDDGLIKVKIELKAAQPGSAEEEDLMLRMGRIRGGRGVMMPANRVQLSKGNPDGVPFKLLAADGKPLGFVNGEMEVSANNALSKVYTLVYKPGDKDAGPAKLEYMGRREVLVEVPFTLKDVPLLPKAR